MIKFNKNKKGFTLVELLVTIVLLGVVATIIVYNMTNVSTTTKESDYEKFVAAVKSAAAVYADTNPDVFNDLYVNKAFLYITVKDLVTNGLYDADTINPYTEEKIGFDEIIKANLDSSSGQLTFTYPVDKDKEQKESFLVAISDYVAWGEEFLPEDCWFGSGTYQFALSDEKGNLIDIQDPKVRENYGMTCSIPEELTRKVTDPQYKEGTYEVTYTWVSESGTKKQAKREVRIMPKVIPTFKTNVEYNLEAEKPSEAAWFTPTYSNGSWQYLTITPYIEQATESTVYTVERESLNKYPSRAKDNDLPTNSKDFNRVIDVKDGSNAYTIRTKIYGHHRTNYYYDTFKTVYINSKLIIPKDGFITGGSDRWAASKTFTVKEPHSPVGVVKYEYRLLRSNSPLDNNLAESSTYQFNANGSGVGIKLVSFGSEKCSKNKTDYPYIAFRAINDEGYVGDWTIYSPANLTNDLNKLLQTDCRSCGSQCAAASSQSGFCYYNSKREYVSYGGQKFVVLENPSSTSAFVAYDGVYGNISPMSLVSGTVQVFVHDATYTVTYTSTSADLQVIINSGQGFLSLLPSNHGDVLRYHTWPGDGTGYTAYVGNVDDSLFSRYRNTLIGSGDFWSTTKTSKTVTVTGEYLGESWSSNVNSYYFNYISSSGYIQSASDYTRKPIKPLLDLQLDKITVCSGDGSSSNPYVIAS